MAFLLTDFQGNLQIGARPRLGGGTVRKSFGSLIRCPPKPDQTFGVSQLATYQELSAFLAEVERRAFKHAVFAVHDEHLALDIVQDAMLKLSAKYAGRPVSELPLLFQRILQNTIRDYHRRQKVRSLWTTLFSSLSPGQDSEDHDPLETLEVGSDSNRVQGPEEILERLQLVNSIEQALESLPARQREAFLLRYWENMDVSQTAAVMGCSEGSVKTHCSRAVHALAAYLKAKGIEP